MSISGSLCAAACSCGSRSRRPARQRAASSMRLMRWVSKRVTPLRTSNCAALQRAVHRRMPSIVRLVSAILVASTTLRRPGAAGMARCASSDSAPYKGDKSTSSLTRDASSRFTVQSPPRRAETAANRAHPATVPPRAPLPLQTAAAD